MPPTHPSQADVAAAYRTLIAHETEPKEQDFYRDRLQRLEQATEPECEFDCRSRVAAAGVGVYCPQCSAKCADTDLATQLAKAIRAAWVDRLDWDELAQGALEFLSSTGRLVPAGGMALTTEQVEDVRTVVNCAMQYGNIASREAASRLDSLLPATEPASYCSKGVCSANEGHDGTCAEASGWAHDAYEDDPAPAEPAEEVKPVRPKPNVGDWGYGGGAAVHAPEARGKTREELLSEKLEQLQAQVKRLSRVAANAAEHGIPAPAEPAEEETKAEVVEPRIWGINTPEPSDVQYVRDRFGSLFKRFAPNVWHRWLPADERFGAADWTWVELASDLPVEVLGVPHELADTKPAEEKSEPEAEAAEICGEFIRLRSRPNICTQPKGHDDDHFNPADLTPFGPVHADKAYPYAEGDHTVLGPEIFTDGYAICWKGEAYVKASMPSSVDELTEAIRFTVEYVGLETLPPTEGWSWYDALLKYAPEKAKAFLDAETGPWETWEAVPEGVAYRSMNGSGVEWFNRDNNRYVRSPGGKSHLSGVDDDDMNTNLAPFVAASTETGP